MTIVLRPHTQKLLEEQMEGGGFATPDEAIHTALQALAELRSEAIDELDARTQAALDRVFAQSACGEGGDWSEVRAELAANALQLALLPQPLAAPWKSGTGQIIGKQIRLPALITVLKNVRSRPMVADAEQVV
ncbi:MAG: hypothetical protein ABSH20_05455 [Tepidisphaeraceae bacterium]